MVKKILVFLLALSMLTLVACGGSAPASSAAPAAPAAPASSAAPAAPASSAAPAAPAAEVRNYKLAEIHVSGYPTEMGDQEFARLVKERTNGSINIEVFNGGTLGDEKTTVEQTQMGDIQFVRVGTNVLSPLNPKMNALTMPYLYRDRDHHFKVLDGPIGEEFRQSLVEQGLLGLCWFDAGERHFYNAVRPVRVPSDMAGMKVRVQETKLMIALVEALGATATPLPLGDVYPAFQNGIIDGGDNNWPSYISTAHYEVAPYFIADGHTRAPEMILVNVDVWNSFTPEEQTIVRECALEAATYQRAEWDRAEGEYRKQAEDAGSEIVIPTTEERQQFVDAVSVLYEDPEYSVYADVYEAIRNTQ